MSNSITVRASPAATRAPVGSVRGCARKFARGLRYIRTSRVPPPPTCLSPNTLRILPTRTRGRSCPASKAASRGPPRVSPLFRRRYVTEDIYPRNFRGRRCAEICAKNRRERGQSPEVFTAVLNHARYQIPSARIARERMLSGRMTIAVRDSRY